MTKSIEDELNLPRIADALKQLEESEIPEESHLPTMEDITSALQDMGKMRQEFKSFDDFEGNEQKLDDLQSAALKAHQDLLDAGFNVEAKHAANFLEPSTQYLTLAIDAEKQKFDHKYKMLKMQMDKQKLELEKEKHELNIRKVDIAERQLQGDDAEVLDSNEDSFMARRSDILRMAKMGQNENK